MKFVTLLFVSVLPPEMRLYHLLIRQSQWTFYRSEHPQSMYEEDTAHSLIRTCITDRPRVLLRSSISLFGQQPNFLSRTLELGRLFRAIRELLKQKMLFGFPLFALLDQSFTPASSGTAFFLKRIHVCSNSRLLLLNARDKQRSVGTSRPQLFLKRTLCFGFVLQLREKSVPFGCMLACSLLLLHMHLVTKHLKVVFNVRS
ncbi:hypothetical protein KC340_g12 [Hortaea werneckii]|nr:hypothetical protein KC340_g12 [Hortaea werneckii]